jgi:CHAD domain-containing protein
MNLNSLTENETFESGFHRISDSLISNILEYAKSSDSDPATAIHEIRKKLKMLRALLKMLRYTGDQKMFEQANLLLRDLGRLMSEIRDAHVRNITLTEIEINNGLKNFERIVQEIIETNTLQVKHLEEVYFVKFNVFNRLISKLETSDHIFNFLNSCSFDRVKILEGYSKTYEDGFNSFFTAFVYPSSELLHEWRKRLKDLNSQSIYLGTHLPDMGINLSEMDMLSDILGEDHDYWMLSDWITEQSWSDINLPAIHKFVEKIEEKRAKLQRSAEYYGKNIYSIEPANYRTKLLQSI